MGKSDILDLDKVSKHRKWMASQMNILFIKLYLTIISGTSVSFHKVITANPGTLC
jgi:hypothetical protein